MVDIVRCLTDILPYWADFGLPDVSHVLIVLYMWTKTHLLVTDLTPIHELVRPSIQALRKSEKKKTIRVKW